MEDYERIRELSDDEIIDRINREAPNVVLGVSFWFDELERRQQVRAAERGERLARYALWLTVANLVVALVAAAAAIATLARSLTSHL